VTSRIDRCERRGLPLLGAAALLLIGICGSAFAQEGVPAERPLLQPKPAWEWRDDERLAARFNHVAIESRNAAYIAVHGPLPVAALPIEAAPAADMTRARIQYVIEGRRNPELLLPHELFDALVGGVDPRQEVRSRARADLRRRLASLNLDPDRFWNAIEISAGEYAKRRLEPSEEDSVVHHSALCAERFESFTAASAAVGEDTLRRVLYTAVAPEITFTSTTDERDPIARLRSEARGCK
jgi:hypothetical protein